MKKLDSNQDLYNYLLSLKTVLENRGSVTMSNTLSFAIGSASCISTEFLGESRIALRQILNEKNEFLSAQEKSDLIDVLKQLDNAFDTHT